MLQATKTVKISSKNQITIPQKLLDVWNLKPNQKVIIDTDENELYILIKPKNWADASLGLGKEMWKRAGGADNYIKKERASWD